MMTSKEALLLAARSYGDDIPLFEHCIGVALLARKIAGRLCVNDELAFNGGLLHDIGKVVYPADDETKSHLQFGTPDHPALSFMILEELGHIDEATIALMHHMYQSNPYPKELPPRAVLPEEGTPLEYICKIVSVADKTEAFMTRSQYSAERAVKTVSGIYKRCPPEIIHALEKSIRRGGNSE